MLVFQITFVQSAVSYSAYLPKRLSKRDHIPVFKVMVLDRLVN